MIYGKDLIGYPLSCFDHIPIGRHVVGSLLPFRSFIFKALADIHKYATTLTIYIKFVLNLSHAIFVFFKERALTESFAKHDVSSFRVYEYILTYRSKRASYGYEIDFETDLTYKKATKDRTQVAIVFVY